MATTRPVAIRPLITAAGGVVWRREGERDQVAVVHRPKYDDFSLPKGKVDPGESFEEAALREVREETGVRARITGFVDAVTYFTKGAPKLVVHYQLEAVDMGRFTPDKEVDELRWLSRTAALRLLSYPTERAVLRKAMALRKPRRRATAR